MVDFQSKKPLATAFKQQNLKAWQPLLTPFPVIISFLVAGIVFLPIGIVLLVSSNSVTEVSVQYNEQCDINSTCTVSMELSEKLSAPSYLYYQLDNFYQNHRRYVSSRNDEQLRGMVVTNAGELQDCDPIRWEGDDNKPENFFIPCGLIAWSLFNDSFVLRDSEGAAIPLRKKGIAWSSDVSQKFKNPPADAPGIRVIADLEDEDFIVWMRTAGLPSFKKLHRIIDQDLPAGTYQVEIHNVYPVEAFKGKKSIVLSTTSWLGGKNGFLGWAYIVVGVICLVAGIVFAVKHKLSPRKLGDTSYLDWK